MPEPNRGNQPNDAFLFHGEYSPLLHSQKAASDAVAWMRKEHPEFYKNGMGANWLSGDAKNNAIEAGHAYRDSLSEEARSAFDSKWQTIMGEHTGASEVGAVSELGRMGARRAAYERKIADAQVELAKQEPSIQRAEEVTPHPVDVDFPAHPSDLETDPFDQGAGQYNQSRRQAAAQAHSQRMQARENGGPDAEPGDWRSRSEASTDAALQGLGKDRSFEPGRKLDFEDDEFLRERVESAGVEHIIGAKSARLGVAAATGRNDDGEISSVGFFANGKQTASEFEVARGVEMGKDAARSALSGGLRGMSGMSAEATFRNRALGSLSAQAKEMEKLAESDVVDPLAAKESVKIMQEAGKSVISHLASQISSLGEQKGSCVRLPVQRYQAERKRPCCCREWEPGIRAAHQRYRRKRVRCFSWSFFHLRWRGRCSLPVR